MNKKLAKVVLAGSSVVAASAHAALPADVTTAITGAGTDVATAGGLVLAVIVGIKVFKWIQRVF